MKKFYSSILFSILSVLSIHAQQIIWGGPQDKNSTFDSGLNDWTTVGISSGDTSKTAAAVWTWTMGGAVNSGAFSKGISGIKSPTATNGAAIFNSDFLDNNGDKNNLGKGLSPAPHSGALISPRIDLTGKSSVALSFYQFFRNYQGQCLVEISSDNGASWSSPIDVNQSIGFEERTVQDSRRIIDITSLAANHSSVRIKFVFDGDYYFWAIDDVTLVTLPDADIKFNKTYYPASAYRTPASLFCKDSMIFRAEVANAGAKDISNASLQVEIKDASGNKIFSEQNPLSVITSPEDQKDIFLNKAFVPNSSLPVGKYYIFWTLVLPSDANTPDNFAIDSFEVSSSVYSLEPSPNRGIRSFQTEEWQGCLYRIPECNSGDRKPLAKSIEFAATANDTGKSLSGLNVKAYLMRVKDEVLLDWSNFDLTNGLNSSSVDKVAEGSYTFTNEANYQFVSVALVDAQQVAPEMDFGARYFAVIEYPMEPTNDPKNWKFQAVSSDLNYFHKPYSVVLIDNAGSWFPEGWLEGFVPAIRLNVQIRTNSDDARLGDQMMQLLDNPVSQSHLRIKLNMDRAESVQLSVVDILGNVVHTQKLNVIAGENVQDINIGSQSSGILFVRLSTPHGSLTKKLMRAE